MLLTEIQTYTLTHKPTIPFSSAASADNSFAFITDKGVDILELAPDLRSVSPNLGCRRYVIKTPADLPTSDVGINPSSLLSHLDKNDAYSLMTDVTASPILTRTMAPAPVPKSVAWSPLGLLHNHRCILSLLTDTGGLLLYVMENYQFTKKCSVSDLWLEHCSRRWDSENSDLSGARKRLAVLKERTKQVKLTAKCWVDKGQDGVGWLATASKSGTIAVWKVEAVYTTSTELNVSLVCEFDSTLKIITALHWITLPSENNLVVVGALDGQVTSFKLSALSDPNSPSVILSRPLWEEKDRMSPTHLSSWSWGPGHILIVTKSSFVIALRLSEDGDKIDYAAYRSCDVSVNGLTRISEDKMVVVTRSCKFTTLTLSVQDKLTITVGDVESYINISHMGCYSVNVSFNPVLCFILLSVNQSYDHLRLREPTQVVICSIEETLNWLINPTKPVNQLSDCLELLRVQIFRKVHPVHYKFTREDLNLMSADQLTITLWWVYFAANVEDDEDKLKSLISLQKEVETLVVSCHFFKQVALYLGSIDSLSAFQLKSLGLLSKWLRKIDGLPEEFSTTLITGRTLLQQVDVAAVQLPLNIHQPETCDICAHQLEETQELFHSECKNGHRLPRCSLSLVQCSQLPYYICGRCGAIAHTSAVKDCGTTCILCCGVLRIDEDIL